MDKSQDRPDRKIIAIEFGTRSGGYHSATIHHHKTIDMKKFLRQLLSWLRLKKDRGYHFTTTTYEDFRLQVYDSEQVDLQDEPFSNFGMMIPKEATKLHELKEDPRGAPIYAGCRNNPCACTGACRRIIRWSQDPKDLAEHRAFIQRQNAFIKEISSKKWGGDAPPWSGKL